MSKKPIKEEPKKLNSYSVELETLIPVTLSYSVQAETPEEALEMILKYGPNKTYNSPKIFWAKIKKIQAKIYKAGTILLLLSKRF